MAENPRVVSEQGEDFISSWELSQLAGALKEAERLEREREEYFQSLYSDIRFFTIEMKDGFEYSNGSPSVEAQALEILDAKNAYNLRIIKLKEKYRRWQSFLASLDCEASEVLRNYFEREAAVPHTRLHQVLRRSLRAWNTIDRVRGKALDAAAREDYKEFRERFPELFKPKKEVFPYLIDGEIKQMNPWEYEMYLHEKEMQSFRQTSE